MTVYDIGAALSLVIAIGSNTALVYAHRKKDIYRVFGAKAHQVHSVMLTIVWGQFVYACSLLHNSSWQSTAYVGIGSLITLIAIGLFLAALKQVGVQGLTNKNIFTHLQKELRGIYRLLPHPMYVSYGLLLFGIGMGTGQNGFYLCAVISLPAFYLQARVEDAGLQK